MLSPLMMPVSFVGRPVCALIGLGVIQDDLDEVDIRLAVVDLGLCDCVLDVDLTLFDREGELFDLFRPISGSRERDLRGIRTGLRRLDLLAQA